MLIVFPRPLSALSKAYIHGHYRLNPKTGQRVWVDSYTDKRVERGRTEFRDWAHRKEHFEQHLAAGKQRLALHAFHDLGHAESVNLAHELGLGHVDDAAHASKRELMEAIHGRLKAKAQELSEKKVAIVRGDWEKRKAARTVGKGERPPADEQPDALLTVDPPRDGSPKSKGFISALQGWRNDPPAFDIRKNKDKDEWRRGWAEGKAKRDELLSGKKAVSVGSLVAQPQIVRHGDGLYAVVWREDNYSGKQWNSQKDAVAGLLLVKEHRDRMLAQIDVIPKRIKPALPAKREKGSQAPERKKDQAPIPKSPVAKPTPSKPEAAQPSATATDAIREAVKKANEPIHRYFAIAPEFNGVRRPMIAFVKDARRVTSGPGVVYLRTLSVDRATGVPVWLRFKLDSKNRLVDDGKEVVQPNSQDESILKVWRDAGFKIPDDILRLHPALAGGAAPAGKSAVLLGNEKKRKETEKAVKDKSATLFVVAPKGLGAHQIDLNNNVLAVAPYAAGDRLARQYAHDNGLSDDTHSIYQYMRQGFGPDGRQPAVYEYAIGKPKR